MGVSEDSAFGLRGFNFVGILEGAASNNGFHGTPENPPRPAIGSLAYNGGPTLTLLPQPGSPVIDAGNTMLTHDQRGAPRPVGARADFGAVEVAGNDTNLQRAHWCGDG